MLRVERKKYGNTFISFHREDIKWDDEGRGYIVDITKRGARRAERREKRKE